MKPYDLPDARGHFGPYGGIFVAETLMHALEELRLCYAHYKDDPEFVAETHYLDPWTTRGVLRRFSSVLQRSRLVAERGTHPLGHGFG